MARAEAQDAHGRCPPAKTAGCAEGIEQTRRHTQLDVPDGGLFGRPDRVELDAEVDVVHDLAKLRVRRLRLGRGERT
jgi:hypothetical protein